MEFYSWDCTDYQAKKVDFYDPTSWAIGEAEYEDVVISYAD